MRSIWRSLLLSLALVLAGCAGPQKPETQETAMKPPPVPPAPPPLQKRRGFVASPDMTWLGEMLTQRLELARAAAWTRFASGVPIPDDETASAHLMALVEPAVRIGMPRDEATAFYMAQLQAADAWELKLRRKWKKRPPSSLALSIERILRPQVEAVDAQILATLIRLRGLPRGKPFHHYLVEQFQRRGIPKPVARIAAAPFLPPRKTAPTPPPPDNPATHSQNPS